MSDLVERFRRSVDGFGSRVHEIGDDQWDNATPCTEWNVRDLVGHLVYEEVWAPSIFEGRKIEEVGDRFEGDLLGDDPVAAWDRAAAGAVAAASEEGALQRTVHLSFGDMKGEDYLLQLMNDHVVHAWDLARGIGADDKLDPDLVDTLLEWAEPLDEVLRASGVFGDKVEIPPDADPQTKLLGVMGRRP